VERPFPYQLTEKVTIRNLTTASGLKPRICPDPEFQPTIVEE
jgi:hypothetical protein